MPQQGTGRSLAVLGAFVVGCVLVGALGAFATASSVATWYPTLTKPSWTPPDAWFGPVWTALYVAMGVAAWLVWRAREWNETRTPLVLFAVQLALNAAWSFLFFGLRSPGLALVEIVALWVAIVATLLAFGRVSRLAAWLLTPYLAWVSFAMALNLAIWTLNR